MSNPKMNNCAMLALFIVLLIDGLGQGILFPLLTKTLVNPHATTLVTHASAHMRTILYGAILGVYFLCWFFGSVIMGYMSDGAGRKKALLICMAGAGLAYLLTALGFICHSLTLIFVSRVIGGLTAGSQPIAQASIVDMSSPEKLTRNIGYIMLSVCMGLIIGPLIGSFLTDSSIVSWFGNTTPLYFGAILSALNLLLLVGFFHETSSTTGKIKLNLLDAITLITDACKHKAIRHLSIIYFMFQVSWVGFYMYCSVFLFKRYDFSINLTGLFLGLIGIGWALGFTVLVPFFKKMAANKVMIIGYGTLGCVALLMVIFHSPLLAWILVAPGAAGTAVGISYTISTYSTLAGADKQGWVMGVSTAVAVLAGAVSVVLVGLIAGLSNNAPFIACFVVMLVGAFISLSFKTKKA